MMVLLKMENEEKEKEDNDVDVEIFEILTLFESDNFGELIKKER